MIGLLRKDLYVSDKTGRLLLALSLVFSLAPSLGAFGSTYAMMLAFMMPLNSIAYDERCRWDRYAAMLPYKPEQLVWSKYLLSYLYTLVAGGIIVLGGWLRGLVTGSTDWRETAELGVMLGVVMLFITAMGLPTIFRLGSEKGRFAMIAFMGLGVGAALGLMGIFGELPRLPALPVPAAAAIVAALAAGATFVSFRLSVRFYRNRRNGRYD